MNENYIAVSLGAGIAFIVLGYIIWNLLKFIAYWKVFTKAGEPGWKSFIPFYNIYVEYGFTWKANMCWLFIVPTIIGSIMTRSESTTVAMVGILMLLVGAIVSFIADRKLAAAFGHGIGFTLGLYFLTPIFIMILAFGKSRYIGKSE